MNRLKAGARFLLRSSAGGVLTRGRIVGAGVAGGIGVEVRHSFDHQFRRPTPAERSGWVTVERDG